jgi:hypothetical protein
MQTFLTQILFHEEIREKAEDKNEIVALLKVTPEKYHIAFKLCSGTILSFL